jgi:hypothetical protein
MKRFSNLSADKLVEFINKTVGDADIAGFDVYIEEGSQSITIATRLQSGRRSAYKKIVDILQ